MDYKEFAEYNMIMEAEKREPLVWIEIRDNENGDIHVEYFSSIYSMCVNVAKIYCFSDYDDTYSVAGMFIDGREVEYTGWQPGMVFDFAYVDNNEIVCSICRPDWDH